MFERNILLLLVLFRTYTYCQSDTLNKFDSDHKKHGYWKVFLSYELKKTDSIFSKYYGYELFDHGVNLTNISERSMRIYKIEYPSVSCISYPCLLNGTFVLYQKGRKVKLVETYKDGLPQKLQYFNREKNNNSYYLSEAVDYIRQYQNQLGSFYWEEVSVSRIDTVRYWFRKNDGKWQSIKIK